MTTTVTRRPSIARGRLDAPIVEERYGAYVTSLTDIGACAGTKPIVMLVDDIPASCERLANALWAAAMDVAVAASASRAREMLAAGLLADVIVLKLPMTGAEGRELWARRSTHLAVPPVPVIAIAPLGLRGGVAGTSSAADLDPPLVVSIVRSVVTARARQRPL